MTQKINIILADDHRIFRDGLKSLLSEYDNIAIIGEVASGCELIEMLKFKLPDLIIIDITMPGLSGIEATKQIMKQHPDMKILVLSMHTNEDFVISAINAGAKGYLPKDISKVELLEAINTIDAGNDYYSKEISVNFMKNFIKKGKIEQSISENECLTPREIEILKLAASGISNKEIAERLFISTKTVDAHKNHIMQKLKLKTPAELVLYAVKNKLIEI